MKKHFLAYVTVALMLTACSNQKSEENENTTKKTEEVTSEEKVTEKTSNEKKEDKVFKIGEIAKNTYFNVETTYTIESAKWIDNSVILQDVNEREEFLNSIDKADEDYEPLELTVEYKSPVDYETISGAGNISNVTTDKSKSRTALLHLKDRPESSTKLKKSTPTKMKVVWLVPRKAEYYIFDVNLLEDKVVKFKINSEEIQ